MVFGMVMSVVKKQIVVVNVDDELFLPVEGVLIAILKMNKVVVLEKLILVVAVVLLLKSIL